MIEGGIEFSYSQMENTMQSGDENGIALWDFLDLCDWEFCKKQFSRKVNIKTKKYNWKYFFQTCSKVEDRWTLNSSNSYFLYKYQWIDDDIRQDYKTFR